ncbi:MAG: LysM peptidoglycan-binding domain-containing protein [Paracoccaceae bacterium]
MRRMIKLIRALAVATLVSPGLLTAAAAQSADDRFETQVERVLDDLAAIFAEEAAVAAGIGVYAAETERALRVSMQSLVDTGLAAGKTDLKIARHLAFAATKRFGRDVPDAFRTARGGVDVDRLLSVVSGGDAAATASRDRDYLAGIINEGDETTVGGLPEPASTAVSAVQEPVAEPVAAETLPARVFIENGERYTIVETGDTLSGIADEIYGDFLRFRAIYALNRDEIDNPSLLRAGLKLRLPN